MAIDPNRLTALVRGALRSGPRTTPASTDVGDADPVVRDAGASTANADTRPRVARDAVISHCYAADAYHGRRRVGEYAERLALNFPGLVVLASPARPPRRIRSERLDFEGARARRSPVFAPPPLAPPLVFFDVETTGLSGGVGTVAFLAGCGYFDDEGFHTRQFFLRDYDDEPALLAWLADTVSQFGSVVTFNGRTFDVPLMDMRYTFHRQPTPFDGRPHLDLLAPARRLWRRREGSESDWNGRDARTGLSCALKVLEEAVLRTGRVGDVPGFEIPARYFAYLQTGDREPLESVFEHNRLDLLSLAALTATAAELVADGEEASMTPHECLAMGHVFERAGRDQEAERCWRLVAGIDTTRWAADTIERDLRLDALACLAERYRQRGTHDEAARMWQHVVQLAPRGKAAREARVALAKYHEHRARDVVAAREQAELAMTDEPDPDRAEALRHRLARLRRKADRRLSR